MKLILALMVGLFLATPICASDTWEGIDTGLEVTWQVMHIADLAQSLDGSRRQYREINPILGSNPTKRSIYRFFAITSVTHIAISYVLPKEYRQAWQYITKGGR